MKTSACETDAAGLDLSRTTPPGTNCDRQYKPAPAVPEPVTEDRRLTDYVSDGDSAGSSTVGGESADASAEESVDGDIDSSDADSSANASADGDPDSSAADTETADAKTISGTNRDSGLSTYAWGTYTCGRCESNTDRVWRDGETLVCSACKEW